MSNPVRDLKRELLAAAERRQGQALPARRSRRRRRVALLAAAAFVVVVGTASAIGGVRDFVLDRGFIGLPPSGATRSAPERGELVVRWEAFVPALRPRDGARFDIFRAWAYADGRIIWDRRTRARGPERGIPESANEFNSGYLEQRFTAEGIELVRSAVAGLIERSRAVLETGPSDENPLGMGQGAKGGPALFVPEDFPSNGAMEVPAGESFVRLHWGDSTPESVPSEVAAKWRLQGAIATPEQVSALRRIEALLSDPESVLPPGAWAVREVRAYVPAHYAVCIETALATDAPELLSMLPPRAAGLLRDQSFTGSEDDVVEAREGGRSVVLSRSAKYCSKLATDEAREVASGLSGLDPEPDWEGFGLAYRVADAVTSSGLPTTIWFEPYLPHGQAAFSRSFG
jgi:hypothetical protein